MMRRYFILIWFMALVLCAIWSAMNLACAQELTMYGQQENGMFRIIGNIVMIEMGDTVHAFSIDKIEYRNGSGFSDEDGTFSFQRVDSSSSSASDNELVRAQKKEQEGEWYSAYIRYQDLGMLEKATEMMKKYAEEKERKQNYWNAAVSYETAFMQDKAKEMARKFAETGSLVDDRDLFERLGMETEYREVMEKIRQGGE